MNIIDSAKKESYKQSIESAIRSAELYIAKNTTEDNESGIKGYQYGIVIMKGLLHLLTLGF